MNIIFGIWRPQGPLVTAGELEAKAAHTRKFAPDGEWLRIGADIGVGIQAQYTHSRSRLDVQPASDAMGNLLVCDGRLDNYRELLKDLDLAGDDTPDSKIILCAYERWGTDCFARLIGDWALALWDCQTQKLYLARDHAGTRTLHYSRDASGNVIWATFLDSYQGTGLLDRLDPIYLSSYLAMLPCYGRTPYRDIQAVLPGHFLQMTQDGMSLRQFWFPVSDGPIICKSSDEYAEVFLHLFKQSVARRTGHGSPILAELSGGMDSTSVVCVADLIRSLGESSSQELDTLSFFNDSDPNWNERPYFTLVEERRKRRGFHLDTSQYRTTLKRPSEHGALYLYPGIEESTVKRDTAVHNIASASGYRSILSGIGGDEFTGGNQNPAVQVADLLVRGSAISAGRSAIAWCLARRISLVELLRETALFVGSHMSPAHFDTSVRSIPWLKEMTQQHCRLAIRELPLIFCRPFGARPKTADTCETWWLMFRSQPHLKPSEIYRFEYRYPYLDRDLLGFLLGVPAEQLSRPGRRRFVMRRALRGIVPEEILERRRKAFLLASHLNHIRHLAPSLRHLMETSLLVKSGYVDQLAILRALDSTIRGEDLRWWVHLSRFAGLESWLQYREKIVNAAEFFRDPAFATATVDRVPLWKPLTMG